MQGFTPMSTLPQDVLLFAAPIFIHTKGFFPLFLPVQFQISVTSVWATLMYTNSTVDATNKWATRDDFTPNAMSTIDQERKSFTTETTTELPHKK